MTPSGLGSSSEPAACVQIKTEPLAESALRDLSTPAAGPAAAGQEEVKIKMEEAHEHSSHEALPLDEEAEHAIVARC
jgi:hypothetical protein